jgi:hypothetical protein
MGFSHPKMVLVEVARIGVNASPAKNIHHQLLSGF